MDALDFSRDVVDEVECPACGLRRGVHAPLDRVTEDQAICRGCGAECVPRLRHSATPGDAVLERSARETGLPAWDIVWARRGDNVVGIELSGDSPFAVPVAQARGKSLRRRRKRNREAKSQERSPAPNPTNREAVWRRFPGPAGGATCRYE